MAEAAAIIELSIGDRQTESCSKLTHFEAPSAGFNHPLMLQNASSHHWESADEWRVRDAT
jgi:hypothetical protein